MSDHLWTPPKRQRGKWDKTEDSNMSVFSLSEIAVKTLTEASRCDASFTSHKDGGWSLK